MTDIPQILPAYIDEAGSRGLLRDLTPARDPEFGLLVALVFDPDTHAQAIQSFTPGFEAFRDTKPPGAKLHITDAFAPGNEAWRPVAERVREEFLQLILVERPIIVYAARRLGISRLSHERLESLVSAAKKSRRSNVKLVGENRPSDERIEDELMIGLALRLDAFAEEVTSVTRVRQVDLLFDETDKELARRYEAGINRTRTISKSVDKVPGWDAEAKKRVEGAISMSVEAPFRIDTAYLGGLHVIGKEHPLILAVDIVANHLAHHLEQLPPDAPLNAPSSVAGWRLAQQAPYVSDDASEDRI